MTNSLYNQTMAMQSDKSNQNGQQNLQQAFDQFMQQVQGKSPQQVLQENGVQMPAFMNAMASLRQMLGGK